MRVRVAAVALATLTGACEPSSGPVPAKAAPAKAAPPSEAPERKPSSAAARDGAAPSAPGPGGDGPRYVVVRAGDDLFRAEAGEEAIALGPTGGATGTASAGVPAVAVLRWVGEAGDRVALATLGEASDGHCYPSVAGADGLRLRLFAERSALVTVTTEVHIQKFDDGTKARLPPGVALHPGGDEDRFTADAGGVVLGVIVPAERRGAAYRPTPALAALSDGTSIAAGTALTVGGATVSGTRSLFGGESPDVVSLEAAGSNARVTVRGPCVELEAMVPRASVVRGKGKGEATDPDREPSGPVVAGHRVESGASLDWCDGGPAGVTAKDYILTSVPTTAAERTCFEHAAGFVQPVCLCAAASKAHDWLGPAPARRGLHVGVVGGGSAADAPPQSKLTRGKATVKGTLPKEIVERVVRKHAPEIRACYEAALRSQPELQGDITIQFVVGPSGKVSVASVKETTMADRAVPNCIAKTFKRWTFPKPLGGDNVIAVMPLSLSPP